MTSAFSSHGRHLERGFESRCCSSHCKNNDFICISIINGRSFQPPTANIQNSSRWVHGDPNLMLPNFPPPARRQASKGRFGVYNVYDVSLSTVKEKFCLHQSQLDTQTSAAFWSSLKRSAMSNWVVPSRITTVLRCRSFKKVAWTSKHFTFWSFGIVRRLLRV